ncbi:MAG: O-antigen polysaccharide polymerase Wzy, partial [Legionellales bacterium]|nr:O-antigen polysaccharide polymerase Wzy [Legionellales bacterium]
MKILSFGLLVCIFCLATFLFAEFGLANEGLITVLTLLALAGLIPFVTAPAKVFLSPSRMYVLSIISFILARPLIIIFLDVDLIQVGDGITIENISKTLAIITLSIWLSVLAFSLVSFNRLSFYKAVPKPKIILPSCFAKIAFCLFVLVGLFFLYKSWIQSRSMLGLDYFSATADPLFYAHTKFFFAAKLIAILWLAMLPSRNNFKLCALLLLIFSSGFLLIGLRGYFISYFFLYMYFLNETRIFKLSQIVICALLLILGSSYILEYRLGFSVYDNALEMILRPFYEQGATFEVVFGVVAFPDRVSDCLPLIDYFLKTKPFGDCVDSARGVPFVTGGFGSSFFAEAYYLGLISLIFISLVVGVFLKFINTLSNLRNNQKLGQTFFRAGLILFFVIPNLVYFGRASAFDFITKVLQAVVIVHILYNIDLKQILFNVRLQGGLGNQLFQYAAGRALARRHNSRLILDTSILQRTGNKYTHRELELTRFMINARISNLGEFRRNSLWHRLPVISNWFSPWHLYVEKSFSFNSAFNNLPDNTYLAGYWQSF